MGEKDSGAQRGNEERDKDGRICLGVEGEMKSAAA